MNKFLSICLIYVSMSYRRRRSRSRKSESRERSHERPNTKSDSHGNHVKRRFTEASPVEGKVVTEHQEPNILNATESTSATMIKTEKEEILPDSTEDVAENVKEDSAPETNTVATDSEIKKEDQPGSSLNNQEKSRKYFFQNGLTNKMYK